MPLLFKMNSNKADKGFPKQLFLKCFDSKDDDDTYAVLIQERDQTDTYHPPYWGKMFSAGNKDVYLIIRMPIRKQDTDGRFITRPKQDKNKNYLDRKGKQVDKPEDAAQVYEYVKIEEDGNAYTLTGTKAVLRCKNTTKSGNPTKQTFFSMALYSDEVAERMEAMESQLGELEGDDRKAMLQRIKEKRSKETQWFNLFIEEGGEFLEEEFDFEIRLPEEESGD
ncbi:hypothetical protein [Neptuniibacter sp. QD37_11]|uniref:hypothetical protein n=1 Tax=Neptuniibacter sp. QD37_11 TaxID=3398209 RepID=UPI0039F5ED8E